MTEKDNKVAILLGKEVCERLRKLGIVGESYNTIINRIILYIEFHPEYWDKKI